MPRTSLSAIRSRHSSASARSMSSRSRNGSTPRASAIPREYVLISLRRSLWRLRILIAAPATRDEVDNPDDRDGDENLRELRSVDVAPTVRDEVGRRIRASPGERRTPREIRRDDGEPGLLVAGRSVRSPNAVESNLELVDFVTARETCVRGVSAVTRRRARDPSGPVPLPGDEERCIREHAELTIVRLWECPTVVLGIEVDVPDVRALGRRIQRDVDAHV